MTNLQPEQPARLPKFGEGMRWEEAIAVSGQTQSFKESLCLRCLYSN
jgi:hypothetical protein